MKAYPDKSYCGVSHTNIHLLRLQDGTVVHMI